jgi:uncharacterized membrane protein
MTTLAPHYYPLAYAHLATVLPAFVIGTWLMFSRKGSAMHRAWGKAYLVLMAITAAISLFMPAVVGPQFLGHFGFIHLFSLGVLYSVPTAWHSARTHQIKAHRNSMIGVYVGGLLIAGSFALMPGRLLHRLLFA